MKIRVGLYAMLLLGAGVLALPFYYMLITSIKTNGEVASATFSFIAKAPTLQPYLDLIDAGLILRATGNSAVVAGLLTLGNILLCPLAGYAFAKHNFPGKQVLFLVLLSTIMVPSAVLLVPSFLLFRDFGWLDTWTPLVIPGLAGAFGVFLSRQFIEKIPDSLLESARVEGVSEFGIFCKIVFPLSKSLIATLGIMTFLGSWNSFMSPLVILLDEKKYTLPLVIAMLQGRFPGKENIQMAGAVISILPVMLLFAIFQRQIVESLAGTGSKED